ncbi:sigma factor-like helix-turn-helix DNA-binding protein [Sphingomonas sp. ST-64]|uniref:Sigma factor-like helix-turn-helix DNA-binding protein n=1 Tax=Sphingomonas plantiphila TaxID=3163295 RepID=A0ABW8YKM1_9SPHN
MSEHLTETEIIEKLEAGLQRMPTLRREIFLAIRLDDLSYVEIAKRTGLSVKQVEWHFAETLFTLHQALEWRLPVPWWKRIIRRIAEKLRR